MSSTSCSTATTTVRNQQMGRDVYFGPRHGLLLLPPVSYSAAETLYVVVGVFNVVLLLIPGRIENWAKYHHHFAKFSEGAS